MEHFCGDFPEDLIYLILLNLPPKSLLRFCSLSKRWSDVIRSRDFAKLHLINSRNKSGADHLFIQCLWYNCKILHYTYTNDTTSSCRGGGSVSLPPPVKFQLPPNWYEYNDPIGHGGYWFDSSSWGGLLCTPKYETDHTVTILVWNPFTHQFRRVSWPVVYTERDTIRDSFVGIGYDHVTDDYKIVVHTDNFSTSVFQTYVMALKSSNNVWRTIDELSVPWGRRESKPVTLDNGDVYWVSGCIDEMSDNISEDNYWVSRKQPLGRFLIFKFSFTDERLTIMPSPPKDRHVGAEMWMAQLGQYEGCLCFFNYRIGYLRGAPEAHWIRIWTLLAAPDNNGNDKATTWVETMNVPFGPLQFRSYERLVPFGFTISGHLMMRICRYGHRNDGDLIVYVAREDRFVVVRLEDDEEARSEGATYYHLLQTESLISPN